MRTAIATSSFWLADSLIPSAVSIPKHQPTRQNPQEVAQRTTVQAPKNVKLFFLESSFPITDLTQSPSSIQSASQMAPFRGHVEWLTAFPVTRILQESVTMHP